MKVNRLLLGNTDVRGCSFGVLASEEAGLAGALERLGNLTAAGSLRPLVGGVYTLDEASVALQELAERRARRGRS